MVLSCAVTWLERKRVPQTKGASQKGRSHIAGRATHTRFPCFVLPEPGLTEAANMDVWTHTSTAAVIVLWGCDPVETQAVKKLAVEFTQPNSVWDQLPPKLPPEQITSDDTLLATSRPQP